MPAGVKKGQTAQPPFGRQHQGGAKYPVMPGPADGQPIGRALIFTGRHRLESHKQIMQSTRARQACIETGIQQIGLTIQRLLGLFQTDHAEEFLGAETDPALKHALKVKFAHLTFLRQFRQAWAMLSPGIGNMGQGLSNADIVPLLFQIIAHLHSSPDFSFIGCASVLSPWPSSPHPLLAIMRRKSAPPSTRSQSPQWRQMREW